MGRIKIGDIFEINTPKGKAYLHYIYKDKAMGDLIRVLPGLFPIRPVSFDKLARSKELYVIFFPLSAANKLQIVEQVSGFPVGEYSKPKYMRTEYSVRGEFLGWHIIDTDTWHRRLVKDLTLEQKGLSPWGIWNGTLLIEKLASGWNLEKWG